MDYFKANIDSMRSNYLEIADFFDKKEKSVTCDAAITVGTEEIESKKVLYSIIDDRVIQLGTLYSNEELIDAWMDTIELGHYLEYKVFMFGLGDGTFAKKILALEDKNITLIVEEPSWEILFKSLHDFDMTELFVDERFKFIFHPTVNNARISSLYSDYFEYKDIESIRMLLFPNYDLIYKDEYNVFLEGIKAVASKINCSQNTYASAGKSINENVINNVPYLKNSKSLQRLVENMPDGFPAIVVAGGPSLDKNVKYLKKAKGKALIVCTDTAMKPVIKAGVIPDIAVAVDAFKGEKYFEDEEAKKVPLVCGIGSGRKLVSIHHGDKFFYDSIDIWINSFIYDNDIPYIILKTGGSVANDAFSLARVLGADRIILIGQDLAYTDDKTHSSKTVEGELNKKNFRYMVMDVDIYGKPIKTSSQFMLYKNWIEDMIVEYQDTIKVIDATEGGILIKGSEIMTLNDAINRECTKDYDFSSIINDAPNLFEGEMWEKFTEYMKSLPVRYDNLNVTIDKALDLYKKIRKCCKKEKISASEINKMVAKSKKLFDKITKANEMGYIYNIIQEELNAILSKINVLESDASKDLDVVCDYSINSLETMKRGIKEFRPQLEEMLNNLENNNQPN